MGIFQAIFKRTEKKTAEKEARSEGWLEEVYHGMHLTVEDAGSSLCFFGTLTSINSAGLIVTPAAEGEELPCLPTGEQVFLRGYRKNTSSMELTAVVNGSDPEALRLGDVALVGHQENRHVFRLPLHVDGELLLLDDETAVPEPCIVLNISVGGAAVLTKSWYGTRSRLRLKTRLTEGTPVQEFTATVLRSSARTGGRTEYGLQFDPLTEQQGNVLVNSMFTVQRKMRTEQEQQESSAR